MLRRLKYGKIKTIAVLLIVSNLNATCPYADCGSTVSSGEQGVMSKISTEDGNIESSLEDTKELYKEQEKLIDSKLLILEEYYLLAKKDAYILSETEHYMGLIRKRLQLKIDLK